MSLVHLGPANSGIVNWFGQSGECGGWKAVFVYIQFSSLLSEILRNEISIAKPPVPPKFVATEELSRPPRAGPIPYSVPPSRLRPLPSMELRNLFREMDPEERGDLFTSKAHKRRSGVSGSFVRLGA